MESGDGRPPWTPFEEGVYPQDHTQMLKDSKGFVGVFRNSRYQVEVYELETPLGLVTWLSIVNVDRSARHDWREFQRIKNELMGPEMEACEVYPAESRLVDTSNQFHLFVLPRGMGFPFGYDERDVSQVHLEGTMHKQRDFEVVPKDLNKMHETGKRTIALRGVPSRREEGK